MRGSRALLQRLSSDQQAPMLWAAQIVLSPFLLLLQPWFLASGEKALSHTKVVANGNFTHKRCHKGPGQNHFCGIWGYKLK